MKGYKKKGKKIRQKFCINFYPILKFLTFKFYKSFYKTHFIFFTANLYLQIFYIILIYSMLILFILEYWNLSSISYGLVPSAFAYVYGVIS